MLTTVVVCSLQCLVRRPQSGIDIEAEGNDVARLTSAFAAAALSTDDALALLQAFTDADPRPVVWALFVMSHRGSEDRRGALAGTAA